MIELTINPTDKKQLKIKQTLEDMSLARKVVEKENHQSPTLSHSGKTYSGFDDIEKYIEELVQLQKQWYACRCDMFAD
ncbi:hypothetical protein [Sediminitomix flava]|uniref:Uncharacterized protein n=1 Tax=Sediminitomix flava TaxID=379075 RepID=A0A315ZEI5_SEDFL|nr:hypothetical protein [Sediminitomix flava]PWJ43941.1 hypothetical protein BC781_101291 [Sediminitomix flava]